MRELATITNLNERISWQQSYMKGHKKTGRGIEALLNSKGEVK